jgi:hypothetical protein
MSKSHDRLQYDSFTWLWNNYPHLRQLFWGTFNDLKQVEKIIGNIKDKRRIILSNMKSLGMVKGVLDFMFYYKGVLHVIDFKVGNDRLSPEQKTFIAQIESQGGKGYEVRTLEEFKSIIEKIIL